MEMPQIEISNTAGAICSPQLSKDIQKYLNVKKVRSMYGLTEVTSACFQNLPTDDNDTLEHNVGAVCDHVEVFFQSLSHKNSEKKIFFFEFRQK